MPGVMVPCQWDWTADVAAAEAIPAAYEGLAGESPLLAARAGLSTAENSLADAAEKIAHGLFADN